MTSILVWYLVSISDGAYNRGNINYSPPLATLEDCQRIQKVVNSSVVYAHCIQLRKVQEK